MRCVMAWAESMVSQVMFRDLDEYLSKGYWFKDKDFKYPKD